MWLQQIKIWSLINIKLRQKIPETLQKKSLKSETTEKWSVFFEKRPHSTTWIFFPYKEKGFSCQTSKSSPQKTLQDSSNSQTDSKNLQTTSILNGRQQTKHIKNLSRLYSKSCGNIINLRKTISRATRDRDKPEGHPINFSKYSFTKNQFKLLNKNLKFYPAPGYYDKKEIKAQNQLNFKRKIKLEVFLELKGENKADKNNNTTLDIPNSKQNSYWEQQKESPLLQPVYRRSW